MEGGLLLSIWSMGKDGHKLPRKAPSEYSAEDPGSCPRTDRKGFGLTHGLLHHPKQCAHLERLFHDVGAIAALNEPFQQVAIHDPRSVNDRKIWLHNKEPISQFCPEHSGHHHIGDQEINLSPFFLKQRNGHLTTTGDENPVALPHEQRPQQMEQSWFIIHQKNCLACGSHREPLASLLLNVNRSVAIIRSLSHSEINRSPTLQYGSRKI